jgi:hypothetical protein
MKAEVEVAELQAMAAEMKAAIKGNGRLSEAVAA